MSFVSEITVSLLGLLFGPPGLDENTCKVELKGMGLHCQKEEDVPEDSNRIALKLIGVVIRTGLIISSE